MIADLDPQRVELDFCCNAIAAKGFAIRQRRVCIALCYEHALREVAASAVPVLDSFG